MSKTSNYTDTYSAWFQEIKQNMLKKSKKIKK